MQEPYSGGTPRRNRWLLAGDNHEDADALWTSCGRRLAGLCAVFFRDCRARLPKTSRRWVPLSPRSCNAETLFLLVLFGGSRMVLVSALQVSRPQCTRMYYCDSTSKTPGQCFLHSPTCCTPSVEMAVERENGIGKLVRGMD